MLFAPFGLLAADDTNTLGAGLKSVAETAGYDQDLANYDNPLAQVVSNVLLAVFSVLGVVFLVLTVYAGFQWMTAGGNTEQIDKSKALLRNAVIGLAIILLSYAITYFIGSTLSGAAVVNGSNI